MVVYSTVNLTIPVKKRAGPPPERKPEGSIDVIGGENSRGKYACTIEILHMHLHAILQHVVK